MKSTRNGNYVGKFERLFFLFFKSLYNFITMSCGVYKICRSKMYDNNSTKAEREEMEVRFLYYRESV